MLRYEVDRFLQHWIESVKVVQIILATDVPLDEVEVTRYLEEVRSYHLLVGFEVVLKMLQFLIIRDVLAELVVMKRAD